MLSDFLSNDKGQLPSFSEKVSDEPHLKVVTLQGDIGHAAIQEVQDFLKKASKNHMALNKSVLLDLRKVTHVDTAAIAGLLKVLSALKQKKFRLAIMNAPDALKDQLEILRLDKIVSVLDSHKKTFSEILAWSEEWD